MAILATIQDGGVSIRRDGQSVAIPQPLPAGVLGVSRKPCLVPWQRRLLIIGQHSRGLIRCENRRIYKIGMTAPAGRPVLANNGGGSGGAVGQGIPYMTLRHKIDGAIVHESNPSLAGDPVDLDGTGRDWEDLVTVDPEDRATHIVLYLKLDEAVAREVAELPLGTSEFTENVPAFAWGVQISFRRGVPPYTTFSDTYHNRAFYAGDPRLPYEVWYSEFGEPESVALDNHIPTKDRDAVTGIAKANEDQLAIFSRRQLYDIQGFRGSDAGVNADFNMRKVDPSIGCISHHSIANIGDRLVFAAEKGIALFDGAPRYVSFGVLQKFWISDYGLNVNAYESSWCVDDQVKNVYKLFILRPESPFSFYYVANYQDIEPKVGTPQLGAPRFGFDVRARRDSAAALMPSLEGTKLREVFTGSCDGQIRQENVDADADDDGDANQKTLIIQGPHDYYEDVGGDRWHGKHYTEFGVLFVNENQPANLLFYPGGDSAPNGPVPTVRGNKPIPVGGVPGAVARGDYFLRPYITGEGLSWKLIVVAPTGVEYAGNYGAWREGLTARLKTP